MNTASMHGALTLVSWPSSLLKRPSDAALSEVIEEAWDPPDSFANAVHWEGSATAEGAGTAVTAERKTAAAASLRQFSIRFDLLRKRARRGIDDCAGKWPLASGVRGVPRPR